MQALHCPKMAQVLMCVFFLRSSKEMCRTLEGCPTCTHVPSEGQEMHHPLRMSYVHVPRWDNSFLETERSKISRICQHPQITSNIARRGGIGNPRSFKNKKKTRRTENLNRATFSSCAIKSDAKIRKHTDAKKFMLGLLHQSKLPAASKLQVEE